MEYWLSASMIAFALSIDAFSIALGLGVNKLSTRRIAITSALVGSCHIFLPLIGMLLGHFLSLHIGHIAVILGALGLIVLGLQMIIASFRSGSTLFSPKGMGLLVFAVSVSMDSFSTGFSMAAAGRETMLLLLLFGTFSMALTALGLVLGRRLQLLTSLSLEWLAGLVLLGFGVSMLFT
ncbi:manganese efflux pump [Paenalkalicoccus suaedae]|uniref:Manganese efflux pump n=1 Tax=Paenalkalicoccus suaedae TaxID=2592382 RepID=A0A859FJ10_9BACI|nr:manganese efflux pump [Paenalkalicoccus suaedae]QKS72762.1 manganese efflux pump [Paenalkalicoccus suaedae]